MVVIIQNKVIVWKSETVSLLLSSSLSSVPPLSLCRQSLVLINDKVKLLLESQTESRERCSANYLLTGR